MDISSLKPSLRRLGCSLLGLTAGNAALLLFLLQNAWRARTALLHDHVGQPYQQVPLALSLFAMEAVVSIIGWIVVGIPVVLLLPVGRLVHLHWILILLIGAALGPLALFIFFVLLSHGHLGHDVFRSTRWAFLYSILVSVVSFVAYRILIRRAPSFSHPEE
jgi:hypothetical protein